MTKLRDMGFPPKHAVQGGKKLNHAHWMAYEAKTVFIEVEVRIEKANRWLGFIQGVLWAENVFTIEELKAHNRGDPKDGRGS